MKCSTFICLLMTTLAYCADTPNSLKDFEVITLKEAHADMIWALLGGINKKRPVLLNRESYLLIKSEPPYCYLCFGQPKPDSKEQEELTPVSPETQKLIDALMALPERAIIEIPDTITVMGKDGETIFVKLDDPDDPSWCTVL